jgi:hypothetical protein
MKKLTLGLSRVISVLTLGVLLMFGLMACGSSGGGGGGGGGGGNRILLPDTGQNSCYDESKNFIDCSGTGQDGDYLINPMDFTDNGDGTVTDNNTDLMWVRQNSSTKYNWFEATGTADGVYNPGGATDVCGSLTEGGYNDWRLPTKKELYYLVNDGTYSPALDNTYFPNTSNDYYWTTTVMAGDVSQAWTTHFLYGTIPYQNKTNDNLVRCVRGSSSASSLTDNGNGTVTDSATGLIWQKCSHGQTNDATCSGTATYIDWQTALGYCESLSLGGHSDWRLPNIKELVSLTDDTQFAPAIDNSVFPNSVPNNYWSSTNEEDDLDYVWLVTFSDGYVSNNLRTGDENYVRCAR